MKALRFAWRSLVRQPARAALGILGVAAVGALLFDMLMLSDGLIISMRDLLDRTGFDVRITASGDLRRNGDRIGRASSVIEAIGREPLVDTVLGLRFLDAEAEVAGSGVAPPAAAAGAAHSGTEADGRRPGTIDVVFQGVLGSTAPWTMLQGRDPGPAGEVVVSQSFVEAMHVGVGASIAVRARCFSRDDVLPPARLVVSGIAEFPFELVGEHTVSGPMQVIDAACGGAADEADVILARGTGDSDVTAAAIRGGHRGLSVATNEQMLGRLQRNGFTYFRQISVVLTTVTLGFALLLITVLLTVSVNQRLGEIAALRALGFSRGRVVADVLCESMLIVGLGGLLSLPLGALLAQGLDGILKSMPGIPSQMNFFVLTSATLGIHAGLLTATAIAAALYPMQIVARLPIAATLRDEVLS